jgi:hypothetical protein
MPGGHPEQVHSAVPGGIHLFPTDDGLHQGPPLILFNKVSMETSAILLLLSIHYCKSLTNNNPIMFINAPITITLL